MKKSGRLMKMTETVLITGATNGIGLELAKIFAKKKYNLVLVARNEKRLLKMKQSFEKKYNIEVMVLSKDLTKEKAVEEIYDAVINKQKHIDILINNAGFGDFGLFHEADWEKLNHMITLNVTALMHMTKLFIDGMIEKGHGKILNVASTAAFQPGPFMAVYFATKACVLSFSEAIAKELEGTGVTVTALCPGPTSTGFEKAAACEKSKIFHFQPPADADKVARYAYRSLMKGKVIAVHGLRNLAVIEAIRVAPRSVVRKMAGYMVGEREDIV